VLAQPSPPIGSECRRPRLTSRWLVTVCEPSIIEVRDRLTGALVQRSDLGLPALNRRLEDVNETYAVASDEKQLWVVRLADGAAAPVAIPPQTVPPHAALTTGGLVVSTYIPGARYPGRVRQMELPALESARAVRT
jgi:hypothetical protein